MGRPVISPSTFSCFSRFEIEVVKPASFVLSAIGNKFLLALERTGVKEEIEVVSDVIFPEA
jgi:hypothetical protein